MGRGCLFGPVMAAACCLPAAALAPLLEAGVTDSKRLTARRRAQLLPLILSWLSSWGLGQASAGEIDRLGIRPANELAMLRALHRLGRPPALLLVDGNLPLRPWSGQQRCVVQGDSRCLSIACASILAKQTRDGLVERLATRFPGYGLESHKGYGTRRHIEALAEKGPTALHRLGFLKGRYPSWGGSAADPQTIASAGGCSTPARSPQLQIGGAAAHRDEQGSSASTHQCTTAPGC